MTCIQTVARRILKEHKHQADAKFLPLAEKDVRRVLEHFRDAGFGAWRIGAVLDEVPSQSKGEAA